MSKRLIILFVLLINVLFGTFAATQTENDIASLTIGNNVSFYSNFSKAVDDANSAKSDCTLKVLKSCSLSGFTLKNANGKIITFDIGDSNNAITFSGTGSEIAINVECHVKLVGNGGTIYIIRYAWGLVSTTSKGFLEIFDGVNIDETQNYSANKDTKLTRVITAYNDGTVTIHGGKVHTHDNYYISTLVSYVNYGKLIVLGGTFDWNCTQNLAYGVTDSASINPIYIYGGYFDGLLWWSGSYDQKYYLAGGKFTESGLAGSPKGKADGSDLVRTSWTNYIAEGVRANAISETVDGVLYNWELSSTKATASTNNSLFGIASTSIPCGIPGEKVTFNAEPKEGYRFVCWKDKNNNDVTTLTNFSVTLGASDIEYKACFSHNHQWAYYSKGSTICAYCIADLPISDTCEYHDVDHSVSLLFQANGNAGLSETIYPSNASNKNLIWSSSNPKVLTVNQKGFLHGVKAGTATVTATSTDGSNITAECTVTVQ